LFGQHHWFFEDPYKFTVSRGLFGQRVVRALRESVATGDARTRLRARRSVSVNS
jgi:hypothetical protein